MVKKLFPVFFILLIWMVFSSPFFLKSKIPYPSDLQVNFSNLWASYPKFWSTVYNPAQPDVVTQIYPWKKLVIDSWKAHQVPFWNPYVFSGTPLLADYQSAAFSITNLFFFIFSFQTAWSLTVLSPPLLAGLFMYLFIKSLNLDDFSAVVSAVSFMFCGFVTTWMSYGTLSLAISILPLALFAIEKFESKKSHRFLFILYLTFPLSFFSGHFQTSVYFAIFVLAYIIFKFWETKNRINFINYLLFSFLGLLSTGVQTLPSIEFYQNSVRSSLFNKISAVNLNHLPTIIAPDFYGNPVTRNNFLMNYAEQSSFFGTVSAILAIFGLFLKNKKVYFFALMALISLVLSLNTPLADLFIRLKIPVLSTASLSRVLVLFSFSGSVLAGYGVTKLRTDLEKAKYRNIRVWILICLIIFSVLYAAIGLKLVNPIFLPIAARNLIIPSILFLVTLFAIGFSIFRKGVVIFTISVIIVLVSFDLLRFATKWQPFENRANVFSITPIISDLLNLNRNYRFIGPIGQEVNNYFRIPGVEGYDPLYINRYGELMEGVVDGNIKSSPRLGMTFPTRGKYTQKVIDLFGIKYVLIKTADFNKPWVLPVKDYAPGKFSLIFQDKQFLIFENKTVNPRAFVVGIFKVQKDKQRIADTMFSNNFNLRNDVVLEKDPSVKQSDIESKTTVVKYSPNEVDINVDSNNEGLLVLADNFYPGWKALVNGKQTEILRADYTFRAVKIPKGRSIVKFYYDSETFKFGLLLTLASMAGIGLILARKWYTIRHD